MRLVMRLGVMRLGSALGTVFGGLFVLTFPSLHDLLVHGDGRMVEHEMGGW
jgi:hypothetical protein